MLFTMIKKVYILSLSIVIVLLGSAGLFLQFVTLSRNETPDSSFFSHHPSSSRRKDATHAARIGGVGSPDNEVVVDGAAAAAWNGSWESVLASAASDDDDRAALRRIDPANFERPEHIADLFRLFPAPQRSKTARIYNKTTYDGLVRTLSTTTATTGRTDGTGGGNGNGSSTTPIVTIVANGGSATAGGGGVGESDRYYAHFVRYWRQLHVTPPGTELAVVPRGHGTRHSLHSAVFAANLLPPAADVLFWEFAINDFGYHFPDAANRPAQERAMLLAWLTEVSKMTPKPPYVVLVYLWRTPFGANYPQTGTISNPVYDSHMSLSLSSSLGTTTLLAEQFDFVVGHVNLASYFDELTGDGRLGLNLADLKRMFLADVHHTNQLGHLAESYLLLSLLRNRDGKRSSERETQQEQQQQQQQQIEERPPEQPEKYDLHCGDDYAKDEKKKFIRNRVVDNDDDEGSSTGWRSPLGSMTLETPRNEVDPTSQRQLILVRNSDAGFEVLGKENRLRIDRQWSVEVACCGAPANSTTTTDSSSSALGTYTTISVPGCRNNNCSRPMKNVRGVFFGFGKGLSPIDRMKMWVNNETRSAAGYLFGVPKEWPCFWTWNDVYDAAWFAFDENQSTETSTLRFCVENSVCPQQNGTSSNVKMISLAVYAT